MELSIHLWNKGLILLEKIRAIPGTKAIPLGAGQVFSTILGRGCWEDANVLKIQRNLIKRKWPSEGQERQDVVQRAMRFRKFKKIGIEHRCVCPIGKEKDREIELLKLRQVIRKCLSKMFSV